jgi:hypothetical protein
MDRLRRGGSLPGRQACAAAQRLRHVGVLSGQYALQHRAPRAQNPAVSVSTRPTAQTAIGTDRTAVKKGLSEMCENSDPVF